MINSRDTGIVRVIEAGSEWANVFSELHRSLFVPAWDRASFNALMDHTGSLALLAVAGSGEYPVGFVLSRIAADEAEILSVGVAKDWQRRGVATQLLSELEKLACARRVSRIFLEVATDNGPATQLYRAQGFSEVGRRPAYYDRPDGCRVDALIMAKAV